MDHDVDVVIVHPKQVVGLNDLRQDRKSDVSLASWHSVTEITLFQLMAGQSLWCAYMVQPTNGPVEKPN